MDVQAQNACRMFGLVRSCAFPEGPAASRLRLAVRVCQKGENPALGGAGLSWEVGDGNCGASLGESLNFPERVQENPPGMSRRAEVNQGVSRCESASSRLSKAIAGRLNILDPLTFGLCSQWGLSWFNTRSWTYHYVPAFATVQGDKQGSNVDA